MTKNTLEIGTLMSGQKFTLPLDLVTRTLAIIAIRGWGKTVAATVIAEEMCEAGLPWVAIDPVGVWWGLRANPDGSPGGYPVVILGGEHGDLPLEKSAGASVAEAILQENVSCVIDMSSESKTTVRHFVADFCDRLMELRPEVPRHIFIEEAPELVPQRPMGEQKRSLAAVDRLIRLGRNRGYGATLISQRTATIQKDVLTQCESLLAGRSIGKPDRDAMQDWIAEVVGVPAPTDANKFVGSLAGLASGTGWFWSPQWLGIFQQMRIRPRRSYHPGATRTVGERVKQVKLSSVQNFVERFGKLLRTEVPRSKSVAQVPPAHAVPDPKVKRPEDENVDFKAAYQQSQEEVKRLMARIEKLEANHRGSKPDHFQQPDVIALPTLPPGMGNPAATSMTEEVAMSLEVRRPVIDVTKRTYVIHASDENLDGQIALLLAEGYFDSPKRNSNVGEELRSRGQLSTNTNIKILNLPLSRLTKYGFLRVVGQATYQSVPGMKVNVKEVEAVA